MTMRVAATSPEGLFIGVAHDTTEEALSELMDELQRRGQGYFEIHEAGAAWPTLAVGLAGPRAVIHLFENADSVSLLQSAGPSSAQAVDVPIMDELATFDSAFALSLETAR